MRTLINYIRSLFCEHEWEQLETVRVFDFGESKEIPHHLVYRWRCTKCGYIMKNKVG